MEINRRTIVLAAAASLAPLSGKTFAAGAVPHELPKLPWLPGALDPVISSRTIGIHHGKHHKGYLDNLNRLVAGSPMESLSLADVVLESSGKPDRLAIFNNAAQCWNHSFYWESLAPNGGGRPGAALMDNINTAFGSYDEFRKAYLAASAGQFGSGWVWLVLDKTTKNLAITKTGNADTPLTSNHLVPLAVVDVWEHAYYLDYENRRADYAAALMDKLFNWRFVETNLTRT